MYSINTNLSANNAAASLTKTNSEMNVTMQQLSTGKKQVNAATAESALAITFQTQSNGLGQAIKNAQTGVNYLNVMSSSVNETKQLLQRMKVLSTQAQNAGYTDNDRSKMQEEFSQLRSEIDRNANSATFNGSSLINAGASSGTATSNKVISGHNYSSTAGYLQISGTDNGSSFSSSITLDDNLSGASANEVLANINQKIQENATLAGKVVATVDGSGKLEITTVGKGANDKVVVNVSGAASGDLVSGTVSGTGSDATSSQQETFHIGYDIDSQNDLTVNAHDLTASGLLVTDADISSVSQAQTADVLVDAALKNVSSATSEFGAVSTRLGFAMDNMSSIKLNTDSALSTLVDTDYAQATTDLAKYKVLNQAASAMLTQANQAPQQAIQLLKG